MKIYESHAQDARYQEQNICPSVTRYYGTGGGTSLSYCTKPHVFKLRSGCDGGGKGYLGSDDLAFTLATNNDQYMMNNARVRKLTPRECERLQGFPSAITFEYEIMTRDELIAIALANKDILVDAEAGKVFRTRGPGGIALKEPTAFVGTNCNGYLVAHLSANGVKKQVRLHRVVWISQHGIPPEGYVVDHINNDKTDNRITNLQLLKAEENSTKASRDGLYLVGEDNPRTKLTIELKERIFFDYQSGGTSYSKLAIKYGISKSRVAQIVKENDYTKIPYRNKSAEDCPDSPRYKAIGNSWCVPCVRWIGKRIQAELDKNVSKTETNR